MEKRVLLPTDFSANAFNAIRYALQLYKHITCDFYFLNVFTVNGYSIDNMMVPEPGDVGFEASKKASEDSFEELMEVLDRTEQNPKHSYHTISTYNSLLYGIKHSIAQKDIDMVIMGTKGATGTKSVIFGTNAVATMEEVTECPVLTIPSGYTFSSLKEIVFPTDYKTSFKRRTLNYLIEIAKLNAASIRILHIEEDPNLSKTQESNKVLLQSILQKVDHSFHTLTNIKVHSGIGAFIESRDSDLLAFVNRKHRFFGSMLSKPLVKEVGYHSKIPVLAINEL